MSNIQTDIIAIDLDDTLLKSDLTVSDYTIEILNALIKKGIYIVLASGRVESAMRATVHRLDIAGLEQGRYIIAQNGASITDLHTRTVIYHKTLPEDIAITAYKLAQELDLSCHVYEDNIIYTPKQTHYTNTDVKLSGLHLEVIENYIEFIKTKKRTKLVIPGEPSIIQQLQTKMKEQLGNKASIFTSKPYFLEVLPAQSGKGEALAFLSEKLNITQEKTMAFGDGMNDESMIHYAQSSVAMKNGLPYIQSIAKYVTEKTNNEDGVAFFMEHHCL